MADTDNLTLAVDLDASAALSVLDDLEERSESFGRALGAALRSAATGGKGLEDVLRGVAGRMTDIALSAGLKPLENLVGQLGGGLFQGFGSGLGAMFGAGSGVQAFGQGGVPGRVMPFAEGGVVRTPTYFPMAGGTGLMGEAGAEAILPLQRGADGALGVAASGGGGGMTVNFHVTATDAASFQRSEAQVTAMLARSVARGRRGL